VFSLLHRRKVTVLDPLLMDADDEVLPAAAMKSAAS
jgi:hypothetical protein